LKQPKKLTRTQKELVSKAGLVASNWMLLTEDNISITIVHKSSGNKKVIMK